MMRYRMVSSVLLEKSEHCRQRIGQQGISTALPDTPTSFFESLSLSEPEILSERSMGSCRRSMSFAPEAADGLCL